MKRTTGLAALAVLLMVVRRVPSRSMSRSACSAICRAFIPTSRVQARPLPQAGDRRLHQSQSERKVELIIRRSPEQAGHRFAACHHQWYDVDKVD